MKREEFWKPSKFVEIDNQLGANPDPNYVAISSRLNVNLLGIALQRVLSQFARGRLLDLGCGSVPLFAQYRQNTTEIMCVDWSSSSHNIDHIDIEADLNAPLPFEPERFDTIVLSDVLEHITAPEALLGETRRVLCDGGILIGTVPFLYRLHEEPNDHYRYTIHSLRRLAVKHGFAIEVLEAYGAGTDVLFDVLGKLFMNMHWRFGSRLAGLAQAMGLKIRNTVFGRKLNAGNQSMPLGYVFVYRAV